MSLAIVAGAGPGLGHALLERFAAGGHTAVGLARSGREAPTGTQLLSVDLTDATQVYRAVAEQIAAHGPPDVVIHNAARLFIGAPADTVQDDFEACWRNMTLSAFILSKAVLPAMVDRGCGTFIVSGATASLRGGARFAAFASAKFALRGLTQSLARAYQPQGVHVAHVILDGVIDSADSRALHGLDEDRMLAPADIAEVYWQLAQQPRSAWTHEIDLRPQSEAF